MLNVICTHNTALLNEVYQKIIKVTATLFGNTLEYGSFINE